MRRTSDMLEIFMWLSKTKEGLEQTTAWFYWQLVAASLFCLF